MEEILMNKQTIATKQYRTITPQWPRRKRGLCKSCCGYAPVRVRVFWCTGLTMPMCAECERQFALMTDAPTGEQS